MLHERGFCIVGNCMNLVLTTFKPMNQNEPLEQMLLS